jgi:hypothetical protein
MPSVLCGRSSPVRDQNQLWERPAEPEAPYVKRSRTSRLAAMSQHPEKLKGDAAKVHAFIESQGAHGATCDEVEVALSMTHQTASARVNGLKASGAIVETKRTRLTRSKRKASVHTLPQFGAVS